MNYCCLIFNDYYNTFHCSLNTIDSSVIYWNISVFSLSALILSKGERAIAELREGGGKGNLFRMTHRRGVTSFSTNKDKWEVKFCIFKRMSYMYDPLLDMHLANANTRYKKPGRILCKKRVGRNSIH